MNYRCFASMAALAAVAIVASLAPASVAGQAVSPAAKTSITHKAGTPPRTPDGQPDLQGVWTNNSVTPLERPKDLAAKEFYTEAELKELAKKEHERLVQIEEQGQVRLQQANFSHRRTGGARPSYAARRQTEKRRACREKQGTRIR